MRTIALLLPALFSCAGAPGGFGSGGSGGNQVGGGDGGGDAGGADTGGVDSGGADTGDGGGGDTGFVGTGYEVGDVAFDLIAPASDGSWWSLYQHAGAPIVLVVGHADDFTTSSCISEANIAADSLGGSTVALIGRDEYGAQADQTAAARLAQLYEVGVLLYDPSIALVDQWALAAPPRTYLLAADLQIRFAQAGVVTAEQIIAAAR